MLEPVLERRDISVFNEFLKGHHLLDFIIAQDAVNGLVFGGREPAEGPPGCLWGEFVHSGFD